MIPTGLSPLANHLWQSTLFAAAVWLVTLALRRNRAAVRYGLWLAASLKFLMPFSLLVSVGSQLEWRPVAAIAQAPISRGVGQIGQPFAVADALFVTAASSPVPMILLAVWMCGFAVCAFVWLQCWRRFRIALRSATPLRLDLPIPVMTSPTRVEPGVFGIRKPVLLLPDGIANRLTDAQLQSIVAHELCHVRRRDNLAAAIHMAVESIFWFHPLVWWIGGRLVEERERACDEDVIRLGNEPHVYAEGILNVCKFYVQSPLPCASGVTGADLRKRIDAIVGGRMSERLTIARKALLMAAVATAVVAPIFLGLVRAQTPVTFEVASIKPADPDMRQVSMGHTPDGGLRFINVSLKQMIANAYNIVCGKACDERISGGPSWINSDRFDVLTKGPQVPDGKPTRDQIRQAAQALLADRFKLVIRRETKELPVYHLVVAKSGHKMKEYTGDDPQGSIRGSRPGEMLGEQTSLNGLIVNLTAMVQRPVIDRTGLTGRYSFKLEWTPELPGGGRSMAPVDKVAADAPEFSGPSIFTALQEQLGLRLEAAKGPVETFTIVSAAKPSAN